MESKKRLWKLLVSLALIFLTTVTYINTANAELYMSISGAVKDAVTGKGIAGVEVIASNLITKQNFSATTNSDGIYYIKMVPEGEYTLYLQPPAAYIFKPYTKSVKVEKGKNVVDANFELPLGGAVSGVIYQNDGVTPLANAQIFTLTNKGVSMASTDSNGKYILSGLEPEASAKLRIITYGYGIVELNNIIITAGQTTSNINIKLPQMISGVRGMVSAFGSVGLPLADAFVVMKGDNSFGITITDSNGNYAIYGLPEGIYEATIFKIGFARKQIGNIFISKEQITMQNFVLTEQPLPQITGLNETEPLNIITLNFPIDNPEFPYVGLQFVASGSCWCASVSFTAVIGVGISMGQAKCRCTEKCGKTECVSWKTINIICSCFGFGIGGSGQVQYCSGIPETGYTGFLGIDIGLGVGPGVSFSFGGGCGGAGGGYGTPGVYWCSCYASVE